MAEARAAQGWRPIKEAPRDGRWLVVLVAGEFGLYPELVLYSHAPADVQHPWRACDGGYADTAMLGWATIPPIREPQQGACSGLPHPEHARTAGAPRAMV